MHCINKLYFHRLISPYTFDFDRVVCPYLRSPLLDRQTVCVYWGYLGRAFLRLLQPGKEWPHPICFLWFSIRYFYTIQKSQPWLIDVFTFLKYCGII